MKLTELINEFKKVNFTEEALGKLINGGKIDFTYHTMQVSESTRLNLLYDALKLCAATIQYINEHAEVEDEGSNMVSEES